MLRWQTAVVALLAGAELLSPTPLAVAEYEPTPEDQVGKTLKAEETDAVSVHAVRLGQRYCGDDRDYIFLYVKLGIEARNDTKENVILTRYPAVGQPGVAASPELGEVGVWETHWESADEYGTEKLSFGSRPDPKEFLVLGPGETYTTAVEAPVLVRARDAERLPAAIVEDSTHVLRAPIDWWAPFFSHSDAEIEAIRERWQRWGILVVGTSYTTWVPFVAPVIPEDTACPDLETR